MTKFEKELNSVRGLCMTCCILTGHMERKEGSYTKLCRIHGLTKELGLKACRADMVTAAS